MFKILPNTKKTFKRLPKFFYNSAKVAEFLQIWSHLLMVCASSKLKAHSRFPHASAADGWVSAGR